MWDNIRPEEVEELEGLFWHLYREDSRANSLNMQRSYQPPDAAGVNLRIRSVRSAVHPYPVDSSQLIQRTAALEEQLKPNKEHTLV